MLQHIAILLVLERLTLQSLLHSQKQQDRDVAFFMLDDVVFFEDAAVAVGLLAELLRLE